MSCRDDRVVFRLREIPETAGLVMRLDDFRSERKKSDQSSEICGKKKEESV